MYAYVLQRRRYESFFCTYACPKSIEFDIKGPNTTISHVSVAVEHAVLYACELLKDGMADAFIVTGADKLTKPLFSGMNALRKLLQ